MKAKLNILVIDDNEDDRALYRRLMEEDGVFEWIITEAKTGEDGLEKYHPDKFQCVLLDYVLPDCNGLDTLKGLVRLDAYVAVIMLTGLGSESISIEAMRSGSQDYLAKDEINSKTLQKTVHKAVERVRMTRTIHEQRQELKTLSKELADEVQERKEEFSESQERLLREEKFSAMGKLAGLVGHEMRGPLGVIKNSTSFIGMRLVDTPDEKVLKHLRILDEEVNRSEVIISNILGFARTNSLNPSERQVNDLVNVSINEENTPPNTTIEVNFDKELPVISVDAVLLKRVFNNLLRNAFQAMVDGGVLTVSTCLEGDMVVVTFEDTGCGIPQENLFRVFEALYTTKNSGTGLGLSACENIINAHQGTISVESEGDVGAKFIIKLPTLELRNIEQ